MVKDVSTGTRIGVVYVMIPMTAEDEDGAVIRIMSSKEPGLKQILKSIACNYERLHEQHDSHLLTT